MPIGRIGGGSNNSIPDLNELDSNPQSVASATGGEGQVGGIGHRAIQTITSGLNKLSSNIRQVADSFAHAIEKRFSGSAKDNLKALFSRSSQQVETPIELKSFKAKIDDTYAQIGESSFENSIYGGADVVSSHDDDYVLADESVYASLSDVTTKVQTGNPDYVNAGGVTSGESLETFEPIYQNISTRAQVDSEEYIEAAPQDTYASLPEITSEPLYGELANISTEDFGGFKPDTTQPADTSFHSRVDSNSPQATKEALGFIKYVLDHHGAAGGKALENAGIFRSGKVIGQVTPQLFNVFQSNLRGIKASNAAKKESGFVSTPAQEKFEKFNSENPDSPVHQVLQKAAFQSAPKLADRVKLEFDQELARAATGNWSAQDVAEGVARRVFGQKLAESFDAGRSDSPLHEILAASLLANAPESKLESIKAGYDQALRDAAVAFAYDGGLDQSFNPDAFKDAAIAAAKATIEKYTI